ncbi:MAG: Gfo/Idh/MocA family oxidoreductase, partial [Eubacteriales bacterium]|nr:Gfo/Idh/MocA family oxidoreductase [Eubacteriales bacterium]
MPEKTSVAVIGCGNFAKSFVPLFKAHPNVDKVYVCDVIQERARKYSEDYKVDIVQSFEEALKRRDIGAVAIFAQRHLHGPFVIAALKNGKHVYSAVP